MVTIDSGISFDFPQTWERFAEGTRSIFHTPRREEIILSASRVAGSGAEEERLRAIEQQFTNGLETARRAASHPDLRVTKPLTEQTGGCAYRFATVLAERAARDAFFGQAVIQHPQGVVFLTYEAPFVDGAEQTFSDLLRMIREI